MTPVRRSAAVSEWEALGIYRELCGHTVFTLDVPASGPERSEPLLVVHGFPTCSLDFRHVLGALSTSRRVLLVDLLGFGLSDKPDVAYTMRAQADIVEAFVGDVAVGELSMLTHDMGDTVGGELLRRQIEGTWQVDIVRRVIANGSIYIEMAKLTAGQEFLLSLPDARLDPSTGLNEAGLSASLAATWSPGAKVPDDELPAQWETMAHADGQLLLPRTIRYIEERRREQQRFTGAIEEHPAPLAVVWGADDPIALVAMAHRLHDVRPDVPLRILDGVGHFPMVEAPERFANAVLAGLDGPAGSPAA